MSSRKAAGRLARSVRSHSKRSVNYNQSNRAPHYGVVLSTDPWEVEMHDGELLLEADDLVVTQWVEKYHVLYGVDVGDTVVITEMRDGDWMLSDVISDN